MKRNNRIVHLFFLALIFLILYNLFSKRHCFPNALCFLNQREGLLTQATNSNTLTDMQSKLKKATTTLNTLIAQGNARVPIIKNNTATFKDTITKGSPLALDQKIATLKSNLGIKS